MPERNRVLLTGATGFLGSHLAARLLDEGHHVIALARGSKSASAKERVEGALREVGVKTLQKLEVVEGDISLAGLGVDAETRGRIASSVHEVWHCAASLSFEQGDREEIFRMNVEGTRNLLEVIERTPTRRLHHVSTAYIAGNRPDIAKETDIHVGQTFKNPYEESKCRSEILVAAAMRQKRVAASVYRPSIVIGDSRTGRATHFHGVYAFIRGLWTVLERMRRRLPQGETVVLPLRVLGAEQGTLNFVPINYVVDAMVEISGRPDSPGETYHLTNPEATPNTKWLSHICSALGVTGIHFVGNESFDKEPMTKLETLFQKQMAFYYQYLQGDPRFDCSRTLAAVAGTGIECPRVTGEFIDKMMGWYVNFLRSPH